MHMHTHTEKKTHADADRCGQINTYIPESSITHTHRHKERRHFKHGLIRPPAEKEGEGMFHSVGPPNTAPAAVDNMEALFRKSVCFLSHL